MNHGDVRTAAAEAHRALDVALLDEAVMPGSVTTAHLASILKRYLEQANGVCPACSDTSRDGGAPCKTCEGRKVSAPKHLEAA